MQKSYKRYDFFSIFVKKIFKRGLKMCELDFTNGSKLPLGVMYGIGQNYDKHAREMGSVLPRGEKIMFIKPTACYVPDGGSIFLPDYSNEVHHEVELVVVLGKDAVNITKEEAWDYIAGIGIGIDATLRDIQKQAKEKGLPWAIAKGFHTSGPISKIVPITEISKNKNDFEFELKINGEVRQKGNSLDMIYSIEELIEFLSRIFTLRKGDVIFTGTPEGVGKLNRGDLLEAELFGFTKLNITCK
jgi:2-keto-4-pentenoate hydratase/2-oxohepta-3-ene-1,7-dioic acid hydratase in catechol pathway